MAAEFTPQIEQACLATALDEIEGGRARQQLAAEGWARGDVQAILAAPSAIDHCDNLLPVAAVMTRKAMSDVAGAIADALHKPGMTVAVVNVRVLLATAGVLQQLKAAGYEVRAPDQTQAQSDSGAGGGAAAGVSDN